MSGVLKAGRKMSSVLSRIQSEMGDRMGDFGRKRVQRAADEIPGLERLYDPHALREAFRAKSVIALPPRRFEDFASPLPSPAPEYVREHVADLAKVKRYADVPFLDLDRTAGRQVGIAGHEGRHRNRAMVERGDPMGLVRLEPAWGSDFERELQAIDPEERLAKIRAALGEDRLVRPQPAFGEERVLEQLPEPFGRGGIAKAAEAVGRASRLARERSEPTSRLPEVQAWHGSPHLFAEEQGAPLGRFRSSKMGTGEGHQAYGRGHYLGESRRTGEYYRDALTPRSVLVRGKERYEAPQDLSMRSLASAWLAGNKGDYEKTLRDFEDVYSGADFEDARRALEAMRQEGVRAERGKGYLYRVDVPDELAARMLDWDRRVVEQPEVARALRASGVRPTVGMPGRDAFNVLEERHGPEGVTRYLSGRGIPGLRYLDQMSRDRAGGTRNMVVFPEHEEDISIVERFQGGGKVGALNRIARIGDEVVRLMDSGPRHV